MSPQLVGPSAQLTRILSKYSVNPLGLGSSFDAKQLHTELDATIRTQRRMYWVAAAMITVVFIAELAVAALNVGNPVVLTGVATAVGVTIWGAVDRMSRLSREMAETSLLIILSEGLSGEALERVIQQLLTRGRI
jgi:hypothetical protein